MIAESREVDVGGRNVTVRQLTVGQMHQWWCDEERHERDAQRASELRALNGVLDASDAAELATLEDEASRLAFERVFSVGGIGYGDLVRMTDLDRDAVDALTQSQAAAVAKACEDLNADFFKGRRRMADLTQHLLTSAPSSPG